MFLLVGGICRSSSDRSGEIDEMVVQIEETRLCCCESVRFEYSEWPMGVFDAVDRP